MNKQKLSDALTALETSTQLHKDAIVFSQRAIESNQLAVKLLIEATGVTEEKLTVDKEKTTVQVNDKYTFLDDNGLHVFSTPDSYRKHIIEFAKEELANLDDRTVKLKGVSNLERDIINTKFEGFKKYTEATVNEKFIVNREKRTVVCLLQGHKTKVIYAKGIAKCDPIDTFNEHIGKIIAFYRAIGEDVPEIFTNVPNPENIQNGDIIIHSSGEAIYEISNMKEKGDVHVSADYKVIAEDGYEEGYMCKDVTYKKPLEKTYTIIDDSNRK